MPVLPFRRRPLKAAASTPVLRPGIRLGGFPSGAGTVLEVASFDPALYGPVGRTMAMSVPAVAACRNLIVGAATQMDLQRYRGNERVPPGSLLTQPDPDCDLGETIAQTVDDLLFAGVAYWLVLAYD